MVRGVPDQQRENTSAEGKASSVQFVRFPLDPVLTRKFATDGETAMLGFDRPHYGHLAAIPADIRRALALDLAG